MLTFFVVTGDGERMKRTVAATETTEQAKASARMAQVQPLTNRAWGVRGKTTQPAELAVVAMPAVRPRRSLKKWLIAESEEI
jgi:hypothetical protein